MFSSLGTPELLVIALVLIILFGGKKLPELTRSVVDSIREFRTSYKDDETTKKK